MLPNILSDDLDRIEQAIQLSSLKVRVLKGDARGIETVAPTRTKIQFRCGIAYFKKMGI